MVARAYSNYHTCYIQTQVREQECAYEEASRSRQEMTERASLADRRAQALAGRYFV